MGPATHFSYFCLAWPQWKNTGVSLTKGEEESARGFTISERRGRAVPGGHLGRRRRPASARLPGAAVSAWGERLPQKADLSATV